MFSFFSGFVALEDINVKHWFARMSNSIIRPWTLQLESLPHHCVLHKYRMVCVRVCACVWQCLRFFHPSLYIWHCWSNFLSHTFFFSSSSLLFIREADAMSKRILFLNGEKKIANDDFVFTDVPKVQGQFCLRLNFFQQIFYISYPLSVCDWSFTSVWLNRPVKLFPFLVEVPSLFDPSVEPNPNLIMSL